MSKSPIFTTGEDRPGVGFRRSGAGFLVRVHSCPINALAKNNCKSAEKSGNMGNEEGYRGKTEQGKLGKQKEDKNKGK